MAWTVVAHTSEETYYRIYAHDALAHLSALRGDRESFDAHAGACDDLGWESGPRSAKAEILYYRGLSYRALGQRGLAEEWLSRALGFAEQHGFNRVLFEAEDALRSLADSSHEEHAPGPAAPTELREGLRAMRQEAVGAEA